MDFRPTTPILQHSIIPFISAKLPQEPQIILEEQPNVIDTVFQHSDPLHTHPKSKSRNFFRIVTDKLEDRWIDHSCAKDFQPAAGLTYPAGLARLMRSAAAADHALNIDLRARLGKREKTWSKSHARVSVKYLPSKTGPH